MQRCRAMQYTHWFNEALFKALFDALGRIVKPCGRCGPCVQIFCECGVSFNFDSLCDDQKKFKLGRLVECWL